MPTYLTRPEIRAHAGAHIMCGFAGQNLDAELQELLREVQPLGVVLFKRNVESAAALRELNAELKSFMAPRLLLVAVDQEGGRVARLQAPLSRWPAMRRLGDIRTAAVANDLAQRVGAALAAELRALHIDVNFAPVLDVDSNPQNPIIGDRAFSSDAAAVARLGSAFISGMQAAGVAACGKHFPGHGDTNCDSHLVLPELPHPAALLRRREWLPFQAAIAAQVGALMTAHLRLPALDAQHPATLSRFILQEILRQELGFHGVIVSDDIEMKALADHYSHDDIALHGLQAGVDVFLACADPAVVLALQRGLIVAAEADTQLHAGMQQACQRNQAWARCYAAPSPVPRHTSPLHWPEHATLCATLLQEAGREAPV